LWPLGEQVVVPTFQSAADFRQRYSNRYAQIETYEGMRRVPVGKYWLDHPRRLTYEGVGFEPGKPAELAGNRLNLWRGFAVERRAGSWRRLLRHIYWVLGGGDRGAGRYIVRWLAWMLQNPGKPAEAVLVFQGAEGAGKGTLARVMLKIFGAYGL